MLPIRVWTITKIPFKMFIPAHDYSTSEALYVFNDDFGGRQFKVEASFQQTMGAARSEPKIISCSFFPSVMSSTRQ